MKKTAFLWALLGAFATGLAGCDSNPEAPTAPAAKPAPGGEAAGKPKVNAKQVTAD